MQDEWYMYMPEVVEIHFERDTGVTDHIPYVTLKGCKEAVTMMVQTVSNNYEGYTKCDMERAILAYKVQSWVANPTDEVFKQMARFHVLKNNPITLLMHKLFLVPTIQGSRLKQCGSSQRGWTLGIWTFLGIIVLNHFVSLTADLFYVDRHPFLIISSRRIHLVTAEYMPSRPSN